MSPWKCPHCGTPQAESARCWACSRSPITCSTCKAFRRSIAGRLGYCGADKAHRVLTGDEVRECWQAPAATPEPFLGLFGSLEPVAPAPTPAQPVHAPAPTAAEAAQRRWNEIVAGSRVDDPIAARGGSAAAASAVSTLERAASARNATRRPARAIPAWLDPGPASVHAPLMDPSDVPDAVWSDPAPEDADAPTTSARPGRPTATWTPAAPVAATPSVLPPAAAPDPTRWRHPANDERPVAPPAPIAEETVPRRPPGLSLLPATLANRLRRHIGTHGWRIIPVEGDPSRPMSVPSSSPSATPPSVRGATPFATARPVGPGRLVEAPSVPPTGTIATLGDQLRRAEQIRRERGLLDAERLRGGRGSDPGT